MSLTDDDKDGWETNWYSLIFWSLYFTAVAYNLVECFFYFFPIK